MATARDLTKRRKQVERDLKVCEQLASFNVEAYQTAKVGWLEVRAVDVERFLKKTGKTGGLNEKTS